MHMITTTTTLHSCVATCTWGGFVHNSGQSLEFECCERKIADVIDVGCKMEWARLGWVLLLAMLRV